MIEDRRKKLFPVMQESNKTVSYALKGHRVRNKKLKVKFKVNVNKVNVRIRSILEDDDTL